MGCITKTYLDMLDQQREEVFNLLKEIDEDILWKRPGPKKWSIGEQLDHIRALTRFMRRLISILWPLLFLVGWLRRHKPYEADIDDVYERPGFPLNVGWMWPPKYTPDNPVSLSVIKEAIEEEHKKVRDFYISKKENVLANAPLYDPAIGWLNMLQVLRVGIHHDVHHYRIAEKILNKL